MEDNQIDKVEKEGVEEEEVLKRLVEEADPEERKVIMRKPL